MSETATVADRRRPTRQRRRPPWTRGPLRQGVLLLAGWCCCCCCRCTSRSSGCAPASRCSAPSSGRSGSTCWSAPPASCPWPTRSSWRWARSPTPSSPATPGWHRQPLRRAGAGRRCVGMVLGVLAAGIAGLLFSPIAARLRGIYLGVASLGLVFIGQHLLNTWTHGDRWLQRPDDAGRSRSSASTSAGPTRRTSRCSGVPFGAGRAALVPRPGASPRRLLVRREPGAQPPGPCAADVARQRGRGRR